MSSYAATPTPTIEGFLEPKNLSRMDRETRMQERVQLAVKDYLDKLQYKEHHTRLQDRVKGAVKDYLDKVKDKENRSKVASHIPHAFEENTRKPIYKGDHALQEKLKMMKPAPSNQRTQTTYKMVQKPPTPKQQREHWIVWRTQTPSTPGKVKPVYRPLVPRNRAKTPTPPQVHEPIPEEVSPPRPMTAPGIRRPSPPPLPPDSPALSQPQQQIRPRSKTPADKPDDLEAHVTYDGEQFDSNSVKLEFPPAPEVREVACSPLRPDSRLSTSSVVAREMFLHPKMSKWVDVADDYEKEVVYNMFKTLNGGKSKAMARSLSANGHHGYSPVPPPQRAVKSARLAATDYGYEREAKPDRDGHDDMQVREWMSEIERRLNDRAKTPQPELVARPKYSLPVKHHHHQIRPGSRQRYKKPPVKEYVHENSFFSNANAGCRGHFIIAPDWVSEGLTIRKLEAQAVANKRRHPPPGCYSVKA
ncbi:uncharacterized protein LOC144443398 isoform X2 [Glandiceps talaboti]